MAATLGDVLRWVARGSGLFLAWVYLTQVLGHALQPDSGAPAAVREWLGIALLSICCLAVVISWHWQLLGAVLSLAALLSFVIVIRFTDLLLIAALAGPGVLYLLDWLAHRPLSKPRLSSRTLR